MEYRNTKHQVARGTRPDAEDYGKYYLIKKVSEMRATYQVRLLLYMATGNESKLILMIPKKAKIHKSLRKLQKQFSKHIKIERDD